MTLYKKHIRIVAIRTGLNFSGTGRDSCVFDTEGEQNLLF